MVSARVEQITGSVHSDKGFYIGDICYVLSDEMYFGVWDKLHGFDDGCFEIPGTGYSFAVGSTAYGDGVYVDDKGNEYGVDAGVIGIVPLELCKDERYSYFGSVFETPGEARFEMYEGRYKFDLPGGEVIKIDTNEDDDEELGFACEYEDDDYDDSAEGWD